MVRNKYTLVLPALELNEIYMLKCACGYSRDLGYMYLTAQRLAELHSSKPGHEVSVTAEPAKPYRSDTVQRRRIRKKDLAEVASVVPIL